MKTTQTLLTFSLLAATASISRGQDDALDIEDLFNDEFEAEIQVSIHDPLESINRSIFKFNDKIYTSIGKPFASAYTRVMPDPVERGISNVFNNIKFPSRFLGNVMQAKFGEAGKETGQFLINSTVGIGGIFQVSNKFDALNTSKEDFGQALGSWGLGHGFYLVIPVMGPTSFRDFTADFVDDSVEPIPTPFSAIEESSDRMALRGIEIVNQFPSLMDLYDSMKRSAIDPYASVRDAYAQRRARQVAE